MDKIYSRPRLKIPKFYFSKRNRVVKNNKFNSKIKTVLPIVIIAILTFSIIMKSINPIFEKLCKDRAKEIATLTSNKEATNVMQKYEYDDLVTVHKDTNNNITMLESNVVNINKIISDVAVGIEDALKREHTGEIYIRLGSMLGINVLSGRGPKIPIKISSVGNIETDFKSEFTNSGINQTLHRLYLNITCEVAILTPFSTIEETITNQLVIAENIIVGNIPSTYYNIEGMKDTNALDIIQ